MASSAYRSPDYTVPKLQDELRKRKLPMYGKKAQLIERLETHEGIKSKPRPSDDQPVSPRERRRKELSKLRSGLTVWTSPFTISKFFVLYMVASIRDGLVALSKQKLVIAALAAAAASIVYAYVQEGSHTPFLRLAETEVLWYGWWVMLGIASSIGLGTGLHTFVLFLGPHIAHVTMAAYKCGSLDFQDRGLERFICPTTPGTMEAITVIRIFSKIRLESFFWGLGTAIGELPPYFVARAAAEAGKDDADFNSIERILEKNPLERTVMERGQVAVYFVVQKLGFIGIVLSASIPNPLFDLAGIICGHFGVPFLTFFGATFIGKACVKNFAQSFMIILLFSEEILEVVLKRLKTSVPALHNIVQEFLDSQVRQFGKGPSGVVEEKKIDSVFSPANIVGILWNALLGGMVLYFLLSMVEALALQEMKRRHDRELIELKREFAANHIKDKSASATSS